MRNLVIQWREGSGNSNAKEHWDRLKVREYERSAEGTGGSFGRSAKAGEEVTVLEDTKTGDGFYYMNDRVVPVAGNLKLQDFQRVYFDGKGNEEVFPPARFLDFMKKSLFPQLKSMLESAGFKNVVLHEESISPNSRRNIVAIVAEK